MRKRSEIEIVPIPLDKETRRRLVELARFVGRPVTECASSLLEDIMRDDEMMNVIALTNPPSDAHH